MLAPTLIALWVFSLDPFLDVIRWGSRKPVRGGASYRSVGLENYRDGLTDDVFTNALFNSIKYMVLTVPTGVALGVLLALVADRRLRGIRVFQLIFSSTIATTVAVTSVIFVLILNPQQGVFKVNWLTDPQLALPTVAMSSIWGSMGGSFVIVLAGLQAVPEEVIEASRLDGYGPVRRTFRIVLPLISPVLFFLAVVLSIHALQAYAQIAILTGGGPGRSSDVLLHRIALLSDPVGLPRGAVMSVGLFVLTGIVTAVQFAVLQRRVHYVS